MDNERPVEFFFFSSRVRFEYLCAQGGRLHYNSRQSGTPEVDNGGRRHTEPISLGRRIMPGRALLSTLSTAQRPGLVCLWCGSTEISSSYQSTGRTPARIMPVLPYWRRNRSMSWWRSVTSSTSRRGLAETKGALANGYSYGRPRRTAVCP